MATETENSIEAKLPKQIQWALKSPTEEQKNKIWDYPKIHNTITQRAAVKSISETCWDHGGKAFPINVSRELEYKTNTALIEPLYL